MLIDYWKTAKTLIFAEQKSKHLTEKCYIDVANATLEEQDVIDKMNSVDRGICEMLPATIITDETKEKIWSPMTSSLQATGLIKRV